MAGEILIDRPGDVVFDVVADQCNEPRCNPAVSRAEQLTAGRLAWGRGFRVLHRTIRGSVEMAVELTGIDRPHRIASTTRTPVGDVRGAVTFVAEGAGTRMRWEGLKRYLESGCPTSPEVPGSPCRAGTSVRNGGRYGVGCWNRGPSA
ncbi:Polyketide cyclase / dehydrase and lipid transport [Geodermatophilus obscurus]|uniref:Polyketide cyclase / dehydrase and lipid transport n=1 Tax=Geodermatophilus obscurus TaxID=1861 RepID=A0A1M7UXL0_9ACTN|nr:Polyketide cyclase / dehydrase and lipid transport [Geodermatophilus obscurus]